MSVVATVLVLVLHHRNAKNYTMPMWVRRKKKAMIRREDCSILFKIEIYINQYLAWFLRMSRPEHDLSWRAIRQRHRHALERQNSTFSLSKGPPTPLLANSSKSLLANVTNLQEQPLVPQNNTLPLNIQTNINSPMPGKCKNPNHHHDPNEILLPRDMRAFRSEMRAIITELRFLTDHVKKEEAEDDVSQDWKFSAMVLDRLCLVVFTIMTTIFSYTTLFSAPNFFKLR